MSEGPIYVTQPNLPPLEEFTRCLEEIWESKTLTNAGPYNKRLEAALCDYLGLTEISLCANGTLALLMALKALALEGEVITTPYSFVATAHVLDWTGLTPVFADIDPLTLNIDPAKVEAAITPRTTAILPVHCYGNPCDVEAIDAIARRHGLKVIYDAAHAFGVRDGGGSILRHGDLSTLSFHATKVFSTFEGGAVVCRDAESRWLIDRLRNFGFVDEVTVATTGINAKLNEISSAFGLLQLSSIDAALACRRAVDEAYRARLQGVPGVRCVEPVPGTVVNYGYFPILVDHNFRCSRDALYEQLKEHEIYARRYFYPLISEFPVYAGLPSASAENLPVASRVAGQVLCLPISANTSLEDVGRVAGVITGDS